MSNTIQKSKKLPARNQRTGKWQQSQQAELAELQEIVAASRDTEATRRATADRETSEYITRTIASDQFNRHFEEALATLPVAQLAREAAQPSDFVKNFSAAIAARLPRIEAACDSVSQPVEQFELSKKAAPIMTNNQTITTKTSLFGRMISGVKDFSAKAMEQGRTFGAKTVEIAKYVSRRISRWACAAAGKAMQLGFAVKHLLLAAAGTVVCSVKTAATKVGQLTSQAKQWVAGTAAPSVIRAYNSVLATVVLAADSIQSAAGMFATLINGVAVLAFQSPVFRKYGTLTLVAAYLSLHVFGVGTPATLLLQAVLTYAELNCVAAIAQWAAESVAQVCSFVQVPTNVVYTTGQEVLV